MSFYLFWMFWEIKLAYWVKVVSYIMLADLCWPGFVQQDLLYENHKCPCVASAECLCPKTKIYAFSFENTKVLTCCRTCIRITHVFRIQSKLEVYFVELFGKGSETRRKRRCFYLCVMSNAFIFDGFLSMGDICFFVLISKTVEWF